MSTQNTASVRRHRATMAKAGYARMEVTLGLGLIKLPSQRRGGVRSGKLCRMLS